jgi:hypothetical protein
VLTLEAGALFLNGNDGIAAVHFYDRNRTVLDALAATGAFLLIYRK